jgi:hypothetical protein
MNRNSAERLEEEEQQCQKKSGGGLEGEGETRDKE